MTRTLGHEHLARLVGQFDRSPAYRGLASKLQELIGDGRIPVGTRLPSERAVTGALGVSRTTVTRAYEDLAAAGFATARRGSGTFAAVPAERRRAHDRVLHPMGSQQTHEDVIDLNCATSSATPGVAAAFERALAALPACLSSDGYLPSGLPELQARVAQTYADRGLPTDPSQIIITSGALSAIAIVARALTAPGDRVMIESPVYPNAMQALRTGGGRLVSAPLADAFGESVWDIDTIQATLKQTAPRVAYLIPDFQNPTGHLMRNAERTRYAAALAATRTTAIVDETLYATRVSGGPMPAPFARYATDAVTVGSASKMFWGGLRVGWIRAPRALVERIIAARVSLDLGSSFFDQLVVAELLGQRDVITLQRERLRAQRDALADALRAQLPEWKFRLPEGGIALWVKMPHGSATRLAAEVERAGVRLAPGPVFTVEGGADQWVRLPFTKSAEQLVTAVERMAEAWRELGGREERGVGEARVLIA